MTGDLHFSASSVNSAQNGCETNRPAPTPLAADQYTKFAIASEDPEAAHSGGRRRAPRGSAAGSTVRGGAGRRTAGRGFANPPAKQGSCGVTRVEDGKT